MLHVGARVGPYELLGELGRGGMGVVFRARHLELGVEHALKAVLYDAGDPEAAARFRREAQAMASMPRHANLVSLHAAGLEGELAWYAMDLVAGQALHERLRAGEVGLEQALGWVRDAARGLAALHARGLVHRDVKPANIVVDETGVARVMDLGLVRFVGGSSRLTRTGEMPGTPLYLPPEAVLGQGQGPAGDVYALGVTLFELLAGRPALSGSVTEVLLAAGEGLLPTLRSGASDAPPALCALYDRMRARDATSRPTAAEVAAALDALLALPLPAPTRGASRVALAAGAAACLALAAGAVAFGRRPSPTFAARRDPPAEAPAVSRTRARLGRAAALAAEDPAGAARECAAARAELGATPGPAAEALRGEASAHARRCVLRARHGLLRRLELEEEAGEVRMLAFAPDGKWLFAACYGPSDESNGRLVAWTVPGLEEVATPVPRGEAAVRACALAPDGAWIAVARGEQVELWSLPDGRSLGPPIEFGATVRACPISRSGLLAVVGDAPKVLLRAPEGPVTLLDAGGRRLYAAAFDAEGQRLAACGDGGVFLWELARGVTDPLALDRERAYGLAFSRDGRTLAAGARRLRSFRAPAWRAAPSARGPFPTQEEVWCCAFGDAWLATGHAAVADRVGEDGKSQPGPVVHLWPMGPGGTIAERSRPLVGGHESNVNTCAVSPDGAILATGDDEGVVCLWVPGEEPPEPLLPPLPGFDQDPVRAVQQALEVR